MAETKEKDERKRGFYQPFRNARLSEEMQDWLRKENKKYKSWEKFFKELRKRYDKKVVLGRSVTKASSEELHQAEDNG